MYYGYKCYDKDSQPLGWLYTFSSNMEYAWTDKNLGWCKRWKTELGAKKHFNHYNSSWQVKSGGGFLKIEVMPITSPKPAESRSLQLLKEWGDDVVEQQLNNSSNPQVWSFEPTPEILHWLESERAQDESDEALLNRKLHRLMKLEQQGF